jgi:CheY-like chemotaxis protein
MLALSADQPVESTPAQTPTSVRIFDRVEYDDIHTVLLAEDDAATRTMLRRLLENDGFVVIDTGSGGNVVEMATGLLPSVIVLDIKLPERDGWSILSELKAGPETQSIPVIVCTVDPDEDRSAVLGAALHLRKPFEAGDLIAGVRKVLVPVPERISS